MNEQATPAGENAIQRFDYEGSPIAFSQGDNVMVNATQMAKKFGKKVNDWLKTQQTKDFLDALTVARKIATADFQPITIVQGGTPANQGTWMHEDVAIEFARWLSPKFAIWCNDRIKELAREGVAVASDDDAVIAHAMQVLQRRLEAKQLQLQAANETITQQTEEIRTLAPLADYTKEVLQSTSTYTLTQVAKDLGFQSIHKFTEWASRRNILYRQSGIWMPYSRFAGKASSPPAPASTSRRTTPSAPPSPASSPSRDAPCSTASSTTNAASRSSHNSRRKPPKPPWPWRRKERWHEDPRDIPRLPRKAQPRVARLHPAGRAMDKEIRPKARLEGGREKRRYEMTQLEILKQRVAALQTCYQTEMDAKNEAYLFIIESGNYENFKNWFYTRRSMGKTSKTAHAECLPALLAQAAEKKEVRYDA